MLSNVKKNDFHIIRRSYKGNHSQMVAYSVRINCMYMYLLTHETRNSQIACFLLNVCINNLLPFVFLCLLIYPNILP